MSTDTTAAATETASKAARNAAKATTIVAESVPVIAETTELALEVPAKVVLNQTLVVTAGVLVGAGLGAAAYWGVQKFRMRNKVVVPDTIEGIETKKA